MTQRNALFLKTKHIGDSIVLTSAISALPEDFVVDIVCFKESAPIFAMTPRVRHIFIIPRHLNGWHRWKHYFTLLQTMSKQSYDLLAQFSDDWRGAFLSRMLSVQNSVAREPRKRPSIWRNSFHEIAKRSSTPRPAAEQDVDLLRKIHLYNNPSAPPYNLTVPEESKIQVSQWLNMQGITDSTKPLIVLHAAARWKFKGLPNSTWIDVINQLHQKKYQVILTGSSYDASFNQTIAKACVISPIVTENFDLCMTAALLEKSSLLISIDSMAVHMASAVKTPVVAMFGPTNEHIWGPWKVPHQVLALNVNDATSFICRPCGLDGCAGSKISQCLYAITPSQILSAVNNLLSC